ncbi:MAG: response regulator transcription factor [Candidatus Omnitrophota bacterium]|nr:response regulator transcription factor [Candidatus Omnitrophota bacterium]MDZ4242785.1 response regulator transcription factor [Candidatus Omnitrophota bacterium]
MRKAKILIVEDEKDIAELVQYNLEREAYQVTAARTGEDGIKTLERDLPDLIILDLMLPGMDGLETCRLIKQDNKTKNIPIIMLTAKSEESDVIVGLQVGADDYVTKPFSPRVLLARIKALLRRSSEKPRPAEVRSIEDLVIDIPKHKVLWQGKPVDLTTIEFNILEFLSRHPGRVFSRDEIMDKVWKEGKYIIDRAVDVHIRGLRKKLQKAADYIETVRGVGYRFKDIHEGHE